MPFLFLIMKLVLIVVKESPVSINTCFELHSLHVAADSWKDAHHKSVANYWSIETFNNNKCYLCFAWWTLRFIGFHIKSICFHMLKAVMKTRRLCSEIEVFKFRSGPKTHTPYRLSQLWNWKSVPTPLPLKHRLVDKYEIAECCMIDDIRVFVNVEV